MIDYDGAFESLDITCDNAACSRSHVFEGGFREALQEAKDSGWQLAYDDGSFYHYCSDECARHFYGPADEDAV